MRKLTIVFLLLITFTAYAKTDLTKFYELQQSIDQAASQLRNADIEALQTFIDHNLSITTENNNKTLLIKIQYLVNKLKSNELLMQQQKIISYQAFVNRERVKKDKSKGKK